MPSSSTSGRLGNALLAAGSTLFALLLVLAAGEAWMRMEYGAVQPGPTEAWGRFDAQRGWAMLPGRYSYFDVQAARRVDVTINALGLRGEAPLAPRPAPGVKRVAIVGDSFIFGPPVGDGETIPARLQALAGPRYEVMSVAVPGYGTGQQYRLVQELAAKGYRLGDDIVLAFFTNDVEDNLGLQYGTLERNPRQPAFHVDASGELRQSAVLPPPPHRGSGPDFLDRLMFPRLLRYDAEVAVVAYPALLRAAAMAGVEPKLPRTPGIVSGWYGPGWQTRWSNTDAVLEYVVKALRALPGSPRVTIAFIPSPFQMGGAYRQSVQASAGGDPSYRGFLADPDRPQRLVGAVAKRLGAPFVDLTPALREAAEREVIYFPREGHLNPKGCALAARVLYQSVLERVPGGEGSPS